MTPSESDNHIEISLRFLAHADEQLQDGDLPQASEKAWGAAAHYLKAVAKRRGWRNESHRDLFSINSRLIRETDDPERMALLFGNLNGLHSNFYEDWYTEVDVSKGIEVAKEYIRRLEQAGVLDGR